MRINEHPKGYLVMDTNCFSHYCEGGKIARFDYDKIRVFVEKEGYWVGITPYTLYECVQDLAEPKNIIEERDKWIKGMKDEKAKATQEFYVEFFEGWDKVVAEKM